MSRLLLIFTIIAAFIGGDPPKGRKGNEHYRQHQYGEASKAYKEGIGQMSQTPSSALSGMYNNYGASLYRQNQYEAAQGAFARSIMGASNKSELSRAAYNAGNAAFNMQQPAQALDFYRQALMANPNNEQARYNYEFAKRQQKQQNKDQNKDQKNKDQPQQNQQQQNQPNQQQNQQNQQQNQQNQQNQQQQNKDQKDQQNKGEQKEDQKEDNSQPKPQRKLSEEQAKQILDAMKNDEQKLLQELRRRPAQGGRTEKDW